MATITYGEALIPDQVERASDEMLAYALGDLVQRSVIAVLHEGVDRDTLTVTVERRREIFFGADGDGVENVIWGVLAEGER